MVALLFPGQGSQFVGMGRDLANQFPVARQTFEEADSVLGFRLSQLAWEGPEADLTLTHNAQPAILVHSIAAYRVVSDRLGEVQAAAGHSLGEFSAYVAADGMALADALRVVRRRGELMLRIGQQRPGTMAAILGLEDAVLEQVCREASDGGAECVAANYNAPGQTVISGDVRSITRAIELAKAAGARRALPLNVSGAFHSSLMQVAVPGLQAALDLVELRRPKFPVISNVTAKPIQKDLVDMRRLMIRQLTSPVRWAESMRVIVALGAAQFIELGPGNVLCGLLKRIEKEAGCRSIGTAKDVEAFASA